MKKILLSVCLLATSIFAFAQKPAEGDHSFTFGISGINTIAVSAPSATGTLLFKHYLKDDVAARIGLSVGTNSTSFTQATFTGGDSIKNTTSSTTWAISLGIQKCFKGTDKLETFIGADILIGGGSSKSNSFSQTSSNPIFNTTTDVTNGSTFKFGFVPCIGMNYFIADWLAVGAEFGWGYISQSIGEGTTTTTVVAGSTSTPSTTKTGKTTNSGFQNSSHGMITVTAAFR